MKVYVVLKTANKDKEHPVTSVAYVAYGHKAARQFASRERHEKEAIDNMCTFKVMQYDMKHEETKRNGKVMWDMPSPADTMLLEAKKKELMEVEAGILKYDVVYNRCVQAVMMAEREVKTLKRKRDQLKEEVRE